MNSAPLVYTDRVARRFAAAALVWGALGMAAGLFVAVQLLAPNAQLSPELSFARLRPLHIHLAVFAFAANVVFAGVYFASQRLLATSLPWPRLGAAHFWGWQAIVALGAIALVLGRGGGAGDALLAWPIELALALVWLSFAANFFAMVRRRGRARLYVSVWFFIAGIVGVAGVKLAGLLAVPVGAMDSYPVFGGASSAVVDAWRERGLDSFLLTAPLLGLMYFVVPQAAARPLFSHRLAILHFWSFVLVAGWAAPERLLNAPVPDWLKTLGIAVALLVWIPAAAAVASGFGTMRGAGSRLLGDPVLQFWAAALVCLGLAALEAVLLGFGGLSLVTGYTDWMHGRSHLGSLGFTGFSAAALLYWLVPRACGTGLHSPAAARAHLYLAVVGLTLYVGATWLAGASQGAMLASQDAAGGLRYELSETIEALRLPYLVRVTGGGLYVLGFVILIWNLARTLWCGASGERDTEIDPADAGDTREAGLRELLLSPPVLAAAVVVALFALAERADPLGALASAFLAACVVTAVFLAAARAPGEAGFHARLEGHAPALTVLVAVAALGGGIVQTAAVSAAPPEPPEAQAPYTPLELAGRDVYRGEGCASCHTQNVRPTLAEVARYGSPTLAVDPDERPALWGTRRVGPDLARVGARHDLAALHAHVADAQPTTGAPMPSYRHLEDRAADLAALPRKLRALAALGAPYDRDDVQAAEEAALREGEEIAAELESARGASVDTDSEMVALLAYLRRLGRSQATEDGREPLPAGEDGKDGEDGEGARAGQVPGSADGDQPPDGYDGGDLGDEP